MHAHTITHTCVNKYDSVNTRWDLTRNLKKRSTHYSLCEGVGTLRLVVYLRQTLPTQNLEMRLVVAVRGLCKEPMAVLVLFRFFFGMGLVLAFFLIVCRMSSSEST